MVWVRRASRSYGRTGGDVMQTPEALTAAILADLAKPYSPGCAVAISRHGTVLWEAAFGLADLERGAPLTPGSIFDVGSLAKQVTAGSVLLLVEAGRLSLEDQVHAYIPELPGYESPLTIDHLLRHTGGLPDYIDLLLADGAELTGVTTTDDALAALQKARQLRFAPGSRFAYTNSGYLLLGLVVERVSGRRLGAFASEHFFGPLGMAHSFFRERYDEPIPSLAMGYAAGEGGSFRPFMSNWEQVGDGAFYTTIGDMLLWADNLVTGSVGGKGWRSAMRAPGRLTDGRAVSYAGGLFIDARQGEPLLWHNGEWAGYRAALHLLPDSGLAVAVACNLVSIDATRLALRVLDVWHRR